MFKKENSKALNLANVLLLLQGIGGIIRLIYCIAFVLFPDKYVTVELLDFVRPGIFVATAGILLFLLNTSWRNFLDITRPMAEKLFRIIALMTVEIDVCILGLHLTYSSDMEPKTNRMMIEILIAIAVVFVALIYGAWKLRIFRTSFANVLNCVNGALALAFGWIVSGFIETLIVESFANTLGTVDCQRTLFIIAAAGVAVAAILMALVANGDKISKLKKDKKAEDRIEAANAAAGEDWAMTREDRIMTREDEAAAAWGNNETAAAWGNNETAAVREDETMMRNNETAEKMAAMQEEIERLKMKLNEEQNAKMDDDQFNELNNNQPS